MGHLFIVTFRTNYRLLCVIESHSTLPCNTLSQRNNIIVLSIISQIYSFSANTMFFEISSFYQNVYCRFYLHPIAIFIAKCLNITKDRKEISYISSNVVGKSLKLCIIKYMFIFLIHFWDRYSIEL